MTFSGYIQPPSSFILLRVWTRKEAMIYHIYIIYCIKFSLERECSHYQPILCDFTKYFYLQCYLVIIETLCITKSVIYRKVLVKNVKIVFTLKQIYFSFPAQTAVVHEMYNRCLFQVYPIVANNAVQNLRTAQMQNCECSIV